MIPEAFLVCALSMPMLSQHFAPPRESFAGRLSDYDSNARWLIYGSYQPMWASILHMFPRSVWLSPFAYRRNAVRGIMQESPFRSGVFTVIWFASLTPAEKDRAAEYTNEITRVMEDGGYVMFCEAMNLTFPEILSGLGFKRMSKEVHGMTIWKKHRRLQEAA